MCIYSLAYVNYCIAVSLLGDEWKNISQSVSVSLTIALLSGCDNIVILSVCRFSVKLLD